MLYRPSLNNGNFGNYIYKQQSIENECPICYEILTNKNVCVLECYHKFHLSCVLNLYKTDNSYNNKCPLCRKEFTEDNKISDDMPDLVDIDSEPPPLERSNRHEFVRSDYIIPIMYGNPLYAEIFESNERNERFEIEAEILSDTN